MYDIDLKLSILNYEGIEVIDQKLLKRWLMLECPHFSSRISIFN